MKHFKFNNRKFKVLISTMILLIFSSALRAQEEGTATLSFLDQHFQEVILILIAVALLIVLWAIGVALNGVVRIADSSSPTSDSASSTTRSSVWEKFMQKLNDAVPIVEENDILLDHDYDGIKELDNHLPPWWKWMFYATIAYSVFHLAYFTIGGNGMNQYEKYDYNVAQAEIQKKEYLAKMANNVDETNVAMLNTPAALQAGKRIYTANCASCHGQNGEGLVGPKPNR